MWDVRAAYVSLLPVLFFLWNQGVPISQTSQLWHFFHLIVTPFLHVIAALLEIGGLFLPGQRFVANWRKSSARWHLQTLPALRKVRSYSPILLQFSPVSHVKYFTWILDNSKLNISHFYCLFFKHRTVLKLIHYINFQNPAQILATFFPNCCRTQFPLSKLASDSQKTWFLKSLLKMGARLLSQQ